LALSSVAAVVTVSGSGAGSRSHQAQALAAVDIVGIGDRVEFHELVDRHASARGNGLHGVVVLHQVVLRSGGFGRHIDGLRLLRCRC
jgi:hypothetical protein